jgi:hypothetical protein
MKAFLPPSKETKNKKSHKSNNDFKLLTAEQKMAIRLKWTAYRNLPAEKTKLIPTDGKYAPLSCRLR